MGATREGLSFLRFASVDYGQLARALLGNIRDTAPRERPLCARSGRSRNTSQICIRGHVHVSLDDGACFHGATPRENWCEPDLALMGNNTIVRIGFGGALPEAVGGGGAAASSRC
jgi:hypothetical protein